MIRRAVLGVLLVVGAFNVVVGAWALAFPSSFFETVATFAPYNHHFLHDVGAFQLGLGAAALAPLVTRNAIAVGLAANAVAGVFHFGSHVVDRDLGGRATDPIGIGLLALLVIAALVMVVGSRSVEGTPGA